MDIIFYAPLGRGLPKEKVGGAERGCQKTLHIYEEHGHNVHHIEKSVKLGSLFSYFLATAKSYLKFVGSCLRYPKAIVHVVGFYGKVVKIEQLLVATSKFVGHKTIYEMRNGGLVEKYKNGTKSYQRTQRSIWRMADGLLCQGQKFVNFIKSETGIDSKLYPNFIPSHSHSNITRPSIADNINLIYFGRLVPTKHVETIIKTAAILANSHHNVKLYLVGGVSDAYKKELDCLVDSLRHSISTIEWYGHRDFDFIASLLQQSHFFIFPSTEPNEGQSNSLTEAMGYGVVPIASTAGFNVDIVDDPTLIVSGTDPNDYAKSIEKIIEQGLWAQKSERAMQLVNSKYTEKVVGDSLSNFLTQISKA